MVYGLQVGPNQSIERGQFRVAKSRASLRVRLNGVAAVFLEQPDRLQVPLPAVGRFHIATFDKSLCGFERAKAQRGTVSRVDRDLFALGRHFGCLDRREGVYGESRLSGQTAAYIP